MAQSTKRVRQIEDVIRHQVAYLLKKEVQDQRLRLMSITSVNLSADLRHANIYFALPEDSDLALVSDAANKAAGFFRSALAEKVHLRYMPKLQFVYDKSIDYGATISALIDQALRD